LPAKFATNKFKKHICQVHFLNNKKNIQIKLKTFILQVPFQK